MPQLVKASKSNPCPICSSTRRCWHSIDHPDSMYCYQPPLALPQGWSEIGGKIDAMGAQLFRIKTNDADWESRKAEWEQEKRQREANLAEERSEFFSTALTPAQRDPLFRKLARDLGLTSSHRSILRARGLTDEQINAHPYFSILDKRDRGQSRVLNRLQKGFPGLWITKNGTKYLNNSIGIAIGTVDVDGMMTGWQFTPEVRGLKDWKGNDIPKYSWCADSRLPVGDGELPIQVINAQLKTTDRRAVWAIEGTLKPLIAAHLHHVSIIGAAGGNFAGSPSQFSAAISEYSRVIVAIDAGDAINPQRILHWQRQANFFDTLGIEIRWAWWGQESKTANDLDEMDAIEYKSIKLLDTDKFFEVVDKAAAKVKNLELYNDLATLKSAATLKYTEEWVRTPKFKPSSISLISSGVGTGKTEAMGKTIAEHILKHPDANVYILTHRIFLGKSLAARMGAEYIADLKHGVENFASINASKFTSLCIDSLHNLDIRDIPRNSLIIIDEVEATLAHTASGGTLGDRTAFIQCKFVEIIRAVIQRDGQIIGAEDSITQITIDTFKQICPDIKPDILVNTTHKFSYPARIGGHTDKRDFVGAILDRLANGDRIAIPTTSQAFGHQLQELIKIALPHIKVARIDSRTTTEYGDFMRDPIGWLIADQIDVLIYSPAIESGVSIADRVGETPYFDSMFLYTANLNVRSQIQLLHRYRGDCPRYIFSPKRLATAQNSFRSEVNFRLARQTAAEEMLRHGHAIKDTEIGNIFNCLDAKLRARDALSASYNRDILISDLESRKHQVIEVDWGDDRLDYQADHPGSIYLTPETIKDLLIECKNRIIEQDATAMAVANCLEMTVSQAGVIIQDPTISFDLKWGAKKRINEDSLPSAPLDNIDFCKFILDKRRKRIDTRAYVLNLDLVRAISGIKIEHQQCNPHVLHYRVPTDEPVALLLQPIIKDLIEIVKCSGYNSEHPAIVRIAQHCIANSYEFYRLKRLQFKPPTQDRAGKTRHSYVTSANKILRMLGWDAVVASKSGSERIYKIENAVDDHADTYIECRNNKLAELQSKHRQLIDRRIIPESAIQPTEDEVFGSYDVDDDEIEFEPQPTPIMINQNEPIRVDLNGTAPTAEAMMLYTQLRAMANQRMTASPEYRIIYDSHQTLIHKHNLIHHPNGYYYQAA